MSFAKKFTKKISLLLIVSILSLNLSFLTVPKKADAQFATFDFANLSEMIYEFGKKVAEATLEATAHALARQLIIKTTEATVDWINGGFEGNGAYIADLNKHLYGPGGVTDSAIGDFFANSSLNFLCNPFRIQVLLALQLNANFVKQIGCTLTGITNNVNNAVNNANIGVSINANTWTTWLNTTLQPQNNPIGAYLIAKNELDTQVGNARGSATLGYTIGQGALSYNRCVDTWQDGNGNEKGKSAEYTQGGTEPTPDASLGPVVTIQKCTVKTPGSIITTMLGAKATSDQHMNELTATLSDGIDQIFAALVNALAQRALSQLKNGVLGNNSASNDAYNSSINNGWTNSMNGYNSEIEEINSNWANATADIPCGSSTVTTGSAPVNYGPLNFVYQDPREGSNYVYYDLGSSQTIQTITLGTFTYIRQIFGSDDGKNWLIIYDTYNGGESAHYPVGWKLNIWTQGMNHQSAPISYRYYKITPGFTWNYGNPTYLTFTTFDTRKTVQACINNSLQPTIIMPEITIPDVYSASASSSPTLWNWNPSSTSTYDTSGIYGGNSTLDQAKNNANILLNSLSKSESAYQNNYLFAQGILTQAKGVFATSSICNMSYNRNNFVLRSLLIRANVITNIDGENNNSDRTIALIPWNLEVIKAALLDSNAKMNVINQASSQLNSAGSITAITDAMIPVNSTSFNTDPQSQMVENIKTWLRGVQSMYSTPECPIDLTRILQSTSTASLSN